MQNFSFVLIKLILILNELKIGTTYKVTFIF